VDYVSLFVARDRSTPYFVGEPYSVVINYTIPVSTSVYTVQAIDNNLSVSSASPCLSVTREEVVDIV